ncbi:MAG: putative iron-regulated rane protein-like protein [Marmoricola sp.]|nr:putative iron-regulated rane protein-like protein [Marmoricola sp.]
MTDLTTEPPSSETAPQARLPRTVKDKKTSARPVRRFLIVTHRWLSLVLGLALLAITTSGAVLVYKPEIDRWLNSAAYAASGKPATVTIADARRTVKTAHPKFEASSVWYEHGVYRVTDYEESYTVDPGTGKILGHVGKEPTWIPWLDNLHECFLSCEGEPGYLGFLDNKIPLTQHAYLGFDGEKVTIGGMILGIFALLLLYLSLTGLWLWFPRRGKRAGKWKKSVSVRWRKGRFARDTDLHNVAGLIAIPLLLLWAVTGMSYEFHFVEKGWYAVTPGKQVESGEAVSAEAPKGTPDITEDAAIAAARKLHPDFKLVNVDLPAADDPTSAYTMYFAAGFDPWAESPYPGEVGVYVDRHTGKAVTYYGDPNQSLAQTIYDDFNYPTHSGYFVNGWWKIIWFVIGLAPLLLAVTGVSTWLVRRKTRKARTKATRAGTALPPVPDDVAEQLAEDPESAPDLTGDARTP